MCWTFKKQKSRLIFLLYKFKAIELWKKWTEQAIGARIVAADAAARAETIADYIERLSRADFKNC